MAIDDQHQRSCTIILHDDRVSKEDVLCGVKVLAYGDAAYLTAPGAIPLCIISKAAAQNGHDISIHISLAQRFNFENRTKGTLDFIYDVERATATHVELFFRDQHLSRADMWRIMQDIDGNVLYKGQSLNYLGSTFAHVEAVYIAGNNVDSAIVTSARTKPIFRSGSARYTLLIQISKEMLEYWEDGDLMYERLLDGYLPELFRKWGKLKVRHQVTAIIFGRSYHDGASSDFFHVVAADISSGKSDIVLRKLKHAINDSKLPRQVSLAAQGNLVEAIHMAAMDFARDDLDLSLTTTGTSIIAITANPGLFETTHEMLKTTTLLLMGNSIGVDIVALSPRPLHPVPLFSYQREGNEEFALPHWVDVSHWDGNDTTPISRWLLPGSPEGLLNIAVGATADESSLHASVAASTLMNGYDDAAFAKMTPPGRSMSIASTPMIDSSMASASTIKESNLHKKIRRESMNQQRDTKRPEIPPEPKPIRETPKPVKRDMSGTHPLLGSGRKISLGPKGLALGRSAASTTVSVAHAGIGKDIATPSLFTPNEASSGLARQIRQSLARKASQQSLHSRSASDQASLSKPIDIQSMSEEKSQEVSPDPVTVMERNLLGTLAESQPNSDGNLSATPKAKPYAVFGSTAVTVEDEAQWTMSPWVTLLNPCNPKRDNMRVATQYRKWQHIFPRAISSGSFKWSSMCSPAALPLTTEYQPSSRALEKHCSKRVRRMYVSSHTENSHEKAHQLIEQLIAIRLSHGFQLPAAKLKDMDPLHLGDKEPITLSLGGVHHELRCLSGSEIQIVEYTPVTASDKPDDENDTVLIKYQANVRAAAAKRSEQFTVRLLSNHIKKDWSSLDEQILRHDGTSVDDGGCRARFVLVPNDPPRSGGTTAAKELSDEERRIDGIQRLTQLWQRNRYFNEDNRQHYASLVRPKGSSEERDPNPLAIEYQTRDPSAVVNAYGPILTGQLDNAEGLPTLPLFAESELFHSSTFDVGKLVRQMQEATPLGVEMRDRRWFTRLHLKCFRGDEMVNWLLRVFKDLHTREDAIAIGNELMRRGIFSHVRHKHEFRDGNYFYQITSSHRTTGYPDTASMFAKSLRSVPTTPMTDARHSPMLKPVTSGSDSSGNDTPQTVAQDRRQLLLSQKMQCNLDPNKKSEQLEVVNLHYDRVHNPENCYHIQLDWVNTTAKLIREAVNRWAALVDSHGLKLVQLPLIEACKLREQHPFDHVVLLKLALSPPDKVPATPLLSPHMSSQAHQPRMADDPIAYQKAILRKLDFVLDLESASSFMTTLDVSYSWGRPAYELTQFVHKSGLVLAQISADERSDFLLLPNPLASHKPFAPTRLTEEETAEDIVKKMTAFCKDKEALKALYDEMNNPKTAAPQSPFVSSPATNVAGLHDGDIPPMTLPPQIGQHRQVLKML